ncbi:related to synaptic vesicle transporter SVOP and related transporters (major facilitator superfamily) [Zygosaccharomyces bailii ISA1307]|nr:related to synaptic vesicle transporter SVOP and related transporters (major facilitator superfamily) [Zygosaccharomyces bailii ISA1307]
MDDLERKKYEQEFVEDVNKESEGNEGDSSSQEISPRSCGSASPGIIVDGKRVLQEYEVYDKLGYRFSWWKKWRIICVIFVCQLSMNFNGSVYPHALSEIAKQFHVSAQAANTTQMIFKVAYGFGCELWAPWSEEYGRRIVMQLSLFMTNIWQILGGKAPNFGSIFVARLLGGLSQAGGSVTLGVVADMWEPQDHGYAIAFVVLASVLGAVIGPIFGGLMEEHLSWHWNFWIQLIFGGVTQLMHFCFVPETRASVLVDREAKRRRKSGEDPDIYGPHEVQHFSYKELMHTWLRPFHMFLCEPIVLFCSLLSGFADHLIFICNNSFTPIFKQWHFSTTACGLIFITLVVSYAIAYPLHCLDFYFMKKKMDEVMYGPRGPERRLLLLLYLAPLLSIGLFGFAWTSMGPDYTPWIAPAIFSTVLGIANYSIYMATIDYMVAAYGPYASSATGGNGLARDLLGGIAQMYAGPLYNNIGGKFHYQWASTLLGCLSIICTIPIYVFYWKGPTIRKNSKFAQEISRELENEMEHLHPEQAAAKEREIEKASRASMQDIDTNSISDKV